MCECPVAVVRELTVSVIHGKRRGSVHVERDVADDANNLETLASTGRNTLPDDGIKRHPGKSCPGKVGAHDDARRRAAVVARIEGTAASTGISRAAKTSPLTVRCWMLNPSALLTCVPARGPLTNRRIPSVIASSGRKKRNAARRDHTGNRSKTASQLLLKGGASLLIVPDARKVHVEREDSVNAEPEIHLLQPMEARQQHAGADQQCERKRELRGRQAAAQAPLPPCTGGGAGLLTKDADRSDTRKTKYRRDAERNGRDNRYERRKCEHDRIESDLVRAAGGRRGQGPGARSRATAATPSPTRPPNACKDQALNKHLAHEPATTRAQGRANRRTPGRAPSRARARGWRR